MPADALIRIVGMRESRELLSGRTLWGAPPSLPTLRNLTSLQNRECTTVARDMNSRSIRSSRRRASRERWSSSTLDKLRLHMLMLGMAPSMVLGPSTGQ